MWIAPQLHRWEAGEGEHKVEWRVLSAATAMHTEFEKERGAEKQK